MTTSEKSLSATQILPAGAFGMASGPDEVHVNLLGSAQVVPEPPAPEAPPVLVPPEPVVPPDACVPPLPGVPPAPAAPPFVHATKKRAAKAATPVQEARGRRSEPSMTASHLRGRR